MKKTIKIITMLLVALMIVAVALPVQATGEEKKSGGVFGVDIKPDQDAAGEKVTGLGNKVLGIIQVVGTIIAVGVLMVIGIKYMMGSAEEKAEYKKTMLPYVIGALILFAAVNIAAVIANMSEQLSGEGTAVVTTIEADTKLV